MQGTNRPAELALPVASLTALRRTLVTSVGPDDAAHALQSAGSAAGDALYRVLSLGPGPNNGDPTPPAEWSEDTFWRRFAALFERRGWGRLTNRAVHTGVGALDSSDWVEVDAEAGSRRPSCHFTSGLLANLLGRVSGEDVAVLEVECRSQGDERCRFLYGSPAALERVYGAMRDGRDANASLAALG
ncbi:MAG: V4R domain-containing protein [Longimicrobiales bacterium]